MEKDSRYDKNYRGPFSILINGKYKIDNADFAEAVRNSLYEETIEGWLEWNEEETVEIVFAQLFDRDNNLLSFRSFPYSIKLCKGDALYITFSFYSIDTRKK